jgi:hypothetical protein
MIPMTINILYDLTYSPYLKEELMLDIISKKYILAICNFEII